MHLKDVGKEQQRGVPSPFLQPTLRPVLQTARAALRQLPLRVIVIFPIPTGISASSPLQTSIVRPAGLADFGPSSASSPLSSPLNKGNNIPGTPKSLHMTSSLASDSLIRKQGKGTNPAGGR